MTYLTMLALLPLQVDVTNFQIDSTVSTRDLIVFGVVVVVVVIVILVSSFLSRKPGGKNLGGGGGGAGSGLFAGFALAKLVKNLGLHHEQKKMLDFVFKTDGVTDPEKSLSTPELLDRHFRRSYRIIEQTSRSEQEKQHKLAVLFSTRNILENGFFGGVTSTRQIKDDTTLTITHGREKINVNSLTAKGEYLCVETPKTVLGSQIKIPKGTRISILFFTRNNKGFSFETRIVGFNTVHGHSAMQLAHSNNLRFLSQRRYKRRHSVIACFLFLVYVEGSGKKQRLVVDKRRMNGSIADISVGGCSIKVMAPIKVGARLKIEFTQGDNTVAALGLVLRSNKTGGSTVIHIKFIRVTQKSMNLINAFVYEYSND
jgi:hypothetical protein